MTQTVSYELRNTHAIVTSYKYADTPAQVQTPTETSSDTPKQIQAETKRIPGAPPKVQTTSPHTKHVSLYVNL